MKSCPDCGSRIHGPYCSWCNEELYIFENQIMVDGPDMKLSEEFIDKIESQFEAKVKNEQRNGHRETR